MCNRNRINTLLYSTREKLLDVGLPELFIKISVVSCASHALMFLCLVSHCPHMALYCQPWAPCLPGFMLDAAPLKNQLKVGRWKVEGRHRLWHCQGGSVTVAGDSAGTVGRFQTLTAEGEAAPLWADPQTSRAVSLIGLLQIQLMGPSRGCEQLLAFAPSASFLLFPFAFPALPVILTNSPY